MSRVFENTFRVRLLKPKPLEPHNKTVSATKLTSFIPGKFKRTHIISEFKSLKCIWYRVSTLTRCARSSRTGARFTSLTDDLVRGVTRLGDFSPLGLLFVDFGVLLFGNKQIVKDHGEFSVGRLPFPKYIT